MTDDLTLLINLIPKLLEGALVTVEVTFFALIIGLLFGLVLGLGRVYGGKLMSWFTTGYSALIRATPPVVTLFILFFVISGSINIPALLAGILAIGISSSAYQSEIFRGAINSVGESQMIAARAVGMTRFQAIINIVLPQAFRFAIPPWSNETAKLTKQSSLVYVLGIPEMLRQAQYVSARTLKPFLVYSTVAVFYLFLIFIVNRGLDFLERKFRIPI